jgi:hypothetical protein
MSAMRFVLAVILALMGSSVFADPINRLNVPAGEAMPTGGTFSIRFPIAFNDVAASAPADGPNAPPVIVRMLTGVSSDGIRLSATETPFVPGKKPQPMEDFMEATKKRAGATVTDIDRAPKDGMAKLSFTLTDASGGTYFQIVRSNDAQYTQVIQFPLAQREKAAALKNDFFGSFKIAAP